MSKQLSLLIFSFFLTLTCLGQEYSYQHYTISDGLPQTQITDLFQDSQGFIWVGTKGGVSRFDGLEFKNFGIEDGLCSRIVCNISEGRDGKIYVLSDHGLSIFDGTKFKPYPFEGNTRAYMNQADVVHDFSGNIWISSKIVRKWMFLKFKNGSYSNAKKELSLPDTIKVNSFTFEEADSSLLLGTELNGIYLIKKNSRINILTNFYHIQIKEKHHDSIIFRAGHQYLNLYNLYKCSLNDPINVIELADSVGTFFHSLVNTTYLFSSYYNDYFVEKNNGNTINYKKKYQRLSALVIDSEENFWSGSEEGFFRLKSKAFKNYTPESGINNNIWSIVEDKTGKIWFASFSNGMAVLDGEKFTLISKKNTPTSKRAFYRGAIKTQNTELLFTFGLGIIKFDGFRYSILEGTPKAAALYLYEDTIRNRLLISSANNGLVIKDEDGNVLNYKISPGPKEEYISTINMDKLGRYWLGGFYGMSIMEGDTITQLPTKDFPFSAGAISSYRDSLDNLWFGTTSGLYIYDYNTFRKIESLHIKTNIMSLAGMAGNKLFIGMVDGIGILDLDDFYGSGNEKVLFYNESNGFLGKECKQNGVLTDSKGFTWVATSDRVVKIDPNYLSKGNYKPRIYIQSVNVISGDSTLEIFSGNKTVSDSSFHLSWKQKDIRIDYHGILHSAPEGVKYKHFLKGYDSDWSAVSNERYASYTNLKYGDYEFQVMAGNGDGTWNEEPAVFKFTIQTAFWQTRIFIFGINLLIIIAILLIILNYIDKKRRKDEAAQEKEKQIAELQLMSIRNQMDPHFIFNSLNSISVLQCKGDSVLAEKYLVKLSKLIREALNNSDKVFVTIESELKLVRNYLEIEKMRFKNDFTYDIRVTNNDILNTTIPSLTIHTFVQNAVKHGLNPKRGPKHLEIAIARRNDFNLIEILDNGIGLNSVKIKADSEGQGLKMVTQFCNVIKDLYNRDMSYDIWDISEINRTKTGTLVKIKIQH